MKFGNFIILLLVIIFFTVYNYRDYLFPVTPCSKTIEFSIGAIDSRFGLSQAEFIKKAEQAASVWNKALNNNVFKYVADGGLKINLIYDSRQQMTDDLKKQGIAIDDDKAIYNSLKLKYDALISSYENQKRLYEKELSDFQAKQEAYNKEVLYWNNRGGALSKDYALLNKEKANLELSLKNLDSIREKLYSLNKQINTFVPILNTLVQRLNLKVTEYNNIGGSNGEEFSEGEYIADSLGQRINIYQFEDNSQLVRVLTHEFGHTLGLDHVADSKAVMYALNIGKNLSLNSADLAELNLVCNK